MLTELLRIQFRIATEDDIARWGIRTTYMPPDNFATIWAAAVETSIKEVFISDVALSLCWGDIGIDDPIPNERIKFLGNLWDTAHMDFSGFANVAALSEIALCMVMGIDRQTWQYWRNDPCAIPEYARLMMARSLRVIPGVSCNACNRELPPAAFRQLWATAVDTPNKEHFVSENGLSLVWSAVEDDIDDQAVFVEIPNERIEFLEHLWDVAHADLALFAEWASMSLGDLFKSMGIDYLSARQWQADPKSIPEYVRVMLARTIGMI